MRILPLAALLAVPAPALPPGTDETLRERVLEWTNEGCARTRTCDLEGGRFVSRDYRVWFQGGESGLGTALSAAFRTRTPESLTRYGFVQTIRGCQFESRREGEGVALRLAYRREFFGGRVLFRHPAAVVDSDDADPLYNSGPEGARHFFHQWNRVPGSTDSRTAALFGEEPPARPELYVTDRPGSTMVAGGAAKNFSLEFEICLHRAADVPRRSAPEEIRFPDPLACFSWRSSYIYDHARGAYSSPDSVHPLCLREEGTAAPGSVVE